MFFFSSFFIAILFLEFNVFILGKKMVFLAFDGAKIKNRCENMIPTISKKVIGYKF
jgi:hypothetical protein